MSDLNHNHRANQILNCNAKRRFKDKPSADFAARELNTDHSIKKHPPLWSYTCTICAGWHVTSSERGR